MSNRDASLATFLLGYIAFLPTIRDNLPETPKIVFTEILVYIQIAVSLICFFYSLTINGVADYVFTWDTDVPFLVCVALTLLNMVVVIGMFFIHKVVWERQYNKLPKGSAQYMNAKTLNTDDNE
jgi:heme/copper-type cytochrome/quinol oxidase subunit 4